MERSAIVTKIPESTPTWARALQQGLSLNPVGVLLVMELARSSTPLSFSDLAERAGASRSITSQRLRLLEQAGFVHASIPAELRKGRRPYVYWLDRPALQQALAEFASIVEAPMTDTATPQH